MDNVELLEDVLLESGSIDRFFGRKIPVDLWRAKKVKSKEQRTFI
ncbi:hypothetical protein [Pseudoalteromonas ostreae]|nr:hypothetical protein [Pseudoalteromonas ostreae]